MLTCTYEHILLSVALLTSSILTSKDKVLRVPKKSTPTTLMIIGVLTLSQTAD